MKKFIISLLLVSISCISFGYSQWIGIKKNTPSAATTELVSSQQDRSVVHFGIDGFLMKEVQTPGGTANVIAVDGSTPIEEKGNPDLPKMVTSLAIPDLADMEFTILSSDYTDYPNVMIAPSKGVIPRTQDPSAVPYTYGRSYSMNAFWPAGNVKVSDPYIIRDVRGQNIIIYPFHYNPVTKTLRVYHDITVELKKKSDAGKNPLTRKGPASSEFLALQQHHFLNKGILAYNPLNDYGKILVICHDAFISSMEPYVDWKNSCGYPTKIVGTSVTGTTATAIKNYITNYYNTVGVTFVLLVGDGPQIPTNTGSGLGGPSDNAYGYLVGNDHYSDVFIGRFSAENVAQVETQVQRTLNYEKFPGLLTDDWYTTVIGIASDQGPGDDNEYDYQHIRNQQTQLLAYTYTMHPELFDGSQGGLDATGNPTPSMVSTEVNNGSSLILYTGHGSMTSWGTSGFSNNNVNQLTNMDKLPFIWSVACVNGQFMNGTCFAEAWLRASQGGQPTGAIGFLGSTINQSWNSPMDGQDEMTDILAESYANNIKRTFAGLSINGCMKMIDDYGSDGKDMADTWTVFGDPSLFVRTANPVAMNVTYPPTVILGATSLTITCDVDSARATVSMNDSLLATGLVENNTVTLNFPALAVANDSMRLVVTAYNKIPFIVDIPIITANGPYVTYYANHVNDTTGNNDHQLDYNEGSYLAITMKNVGVAATSDLQVTLRSEDEFVVIQDSVESYGAIDPGMVKTVTDGFKVFIPGATPDGHVISFRLISQDSTTTWESTFELPVHAPAIAMGNVQVIDSLGNNNGRIDPGEDVFFRIFISNNGSDEALNVTGQLISANPFVTIVSPQKTYGSISAGGNSSRLFEATVDPTTPEGQTAAFLLEMTASPVITASGVFDFTIGKMPVLIVDMESDTNSSGFMHQSVNNLGIASDYVMNTLPADLSNYKSVFVCLGTYPDNHQLTNDDGQLLADYLDDGGRLYMEGGDTWKFDPQTPVHPKFHINGLEDGSGDLGTINGYSGTFTAGMIFMFAGDNSYIDRLSAGTDAFPILKNATPDYITTIAYDAGVYRTIGSSSEFGGLTDDVLPSTKDNLMKEYLNFFGIQSPPLTASFLGYPTRVIPGSSVTYTDYSSGTVTTWNWTFPGGTPSSSTEKNPVVVYENPGIYDARLIVSDGTTSDTLLRENYITVDYPTGLSTSSLINCRIYPNPGNGLFTVKGETGEDHLSMEVFDLFGKKISSETVLPLGNVFSSSLDLTGSPEGVYILKISGKKNLTTRKLVIRR